MPSILVTGANRGLGLEFVRQYAADGWRVYACCRAPEKAGELTAVTQTWEGSVTLHKLTVADHASIETLAEELNGHPIDILLNNAGMYGRRGFAEGGLEDQVFGSVDYDGWYQTLAINAMAPLKMCEAFVEHVAASDQKKIFSMSSLMGSIATPPGGDHLPYGSTKASLNFLMSSLAIVLKDRGITVMPLHPGWVSTDTGGPAAPVTPLESVTGLRKIMDSASLETAGQFIDWNGDSVPW